MKCEYGCEQEAKYQLKNGKWCCSLSPNCCSINRQKNSKGKIGIRPTVPHTYNKVLCQYCNILIGENNIGSHELVCLLNPKNTKFCKQCGKQIERGWNRKNVLFCSHSCASRYSNIHRVYKPGHDIRTKTVKCSICGNTLTVNIRASQNRCKCKACINSKIKKYNCTCLVCRKKFIHLGHKTKTCSSNCLTILLSQNSRSNPNCGGHRNKKRGMYKGIQMDSSWEIEIAKWLDFKNITWLRSTDIMLWWTDIGGKKHKYFPDFYLPKYNLYLDPKNDFCIEQDKEKLGAVVKENNIKLWYGNYLDIIKKLETLM